MVVCNLPLIYKKPTSCLRCAHAEPFYDSVIDDYDGVHVDLAAGSSSASSSSSGLKRLGVSLGLKLRPWEGSCGVRSAKSEVSLIDFTDDSFSSATPSPLTETTTRRQPDDDTLKVQPAGVVVIKKVVIQRLWIHLVKAHLSTRYLLSLGYLLYILGSN